MEVFLTWPTLAGSCLSGGATTTTNARTQRWTTAHPQSSPRPVAVEKTAIRRCASPTFHRATAATITEQNHSRSTLFLEALTRATVTANPLVITGRTEPLKPKPPMPSGLIKRVGSIDHGTEGAAEVLSIAFEGRSKTYFLGERTAGFTNSAFITTLADGALLKIVTQQVFDRSGRAYPEGAKPDLQVSDPPTVVSITEHPSVIAAVNWLGSQEQ